MNDHPGEPSPAKEGGFTDRHLERLAREQYLIGDVGSVELLPQTEYSAAVSARPPRARLAASSSS